MLKLQETLTSFMETVILSDTWNPHHKTTTGQIEIFASSNPLLVAVNAQIICLIEPQIQRNFTSFLFNLQFPAHSGNRHHFQSQLFSLELVIQNHAHGTFLITTKSDFSPTITHDPSNKKFLSHVHQHFYTNLLAMSQSFTNSSNLT